MSEFQPQTNRCFAFDKKADAHPKAPDWKGKIKIDVPGVYDVAIWKGYADKAHKYKGVSVRLEPPFNKEGGGNVGNTPPPAPVLGPDGTPMPF